MKKADQRLKKLAFTFSVLLLFLIISALTNPTKEDYVKFDEAETGIPMPENARIAVADFFFFSVYASTPKDAIDEYGIVYLGFMGQFFQVKDGQFDESIWDNFLK
jgi:hypothetical protein